MKHILIKSLFVILFAGIATKESFSQQQSIVNLILTSFNGASQGFPSLIHDTIPDFGGWDYKIDSKVVQQYANVRDIKLNFKKGYRSVLMKDSLFQLNQMQIRSGSILLPADKKWEDYKDTLTAYYDRQVEFFKKAFGSQLNYTKIIPLENESDSYYKPRFMIYFYSRTLNIPDHITDKHEIEKQLDVTSWFTVELQEQKLTRTVYLVYRIGGGQRWPK